VLEVAVLASRSTVLELADLPQWFVTSAKAGREYRLDVEVAIRPDRSGRSGIGSAEVPLSKSFSVTMRKFESAVLMYYLDRNRGCLSGAARDAGIPKATFHRKAVRHRLAAFATGRR
jgi:transcriptional regulator of acetoin/glycerol metabolism